MDINQTLHRVRRSERDQMLGGVCAGFAVATDTPPWLWRAGFALAAFTFGSGALLYLILWAVIPPRGHAD